MTTRKSYTQEFKREAVRLAKERGNICADARNLGISDNALQSWKKQLEKTPENILNRPMAVHASSPNSKKSASFAAKSGSCV